MLAGRNTHNTHAYLYFISISTVPLLAGTTTPETKMPYMPPTRCTTPDCGKLATHHGHCPQHQPPPWQTPSPHTKKLNRTQEKKWRNTVRTNANNTCQHCGQYTPHGEADHITPIADGGSYYDPNNGQWLCRKCHQQKTKKENKQRQQQHKHKTNNHPQNFNEAGE